jgi:hypothetical protein
LLIAASQAVDLVVGEVRKLTDSANPLGNALPIMPIDDTLYFRSFSHRNGPQALASCRTRRKRTNSHNNNALNLDDLTCSLLCRTALNAVRVGRRLNFLGVHPKGYRRKGQDV